MTKRKQRVLLGGIVLLLIWYGAAKMLHNAIILPDPIRVFETMVMQIRDPAFYHAVFQSGIRVMIGFSVALVMAVLFAFATFFYPWFKDICDPLFLITRSIPNISYILIVLFWCSAQTSVMVIGFLILFPTLYTTLYQGLCDVPQAYHDVMHLYPGKKLFDCYYVYLPFLSPYFHTAVKTGLSLGLKVGIMAEILGQVNVGIGRQLNICRLNLDMAGVFAWTLWIMILLFGMEHMVTYIKNRCARK